MNSLVRHPDTPAGAIQSIDARLERVPGGAVATFIAKGDIANLIVPPSAKPVRTDELWRTTCFELFVSGENEAYREFNFSPSSAWAAYAFASYRHDMSEAAADVLMRISHEPDRLILIADIRCELPPMAQVGMSAVIEETDGEIRYWATSFAPGKPDFHAPAVRCLLLDEVEAE